MVNSVLVARMNSDFLVCDRSLSHAAHTSQHYDVKDRDNCGIAPPKTYHDRFQPYYLVNSIGESVDY